MYIHSKINTNIPTYMNTKNSSISGTIKISKFPFVSNKFYF